MNLATARKFIEQPANVAVLKMLIRDRGATVPEIAKARDTELHTVRASLSRFRKVPKLKISNELNERRGRVYHAAGLPAPKRRARKRG